jgi:hypothetical protein
MFSSSSHLFLFRCSAPIYSHLFLFRCSAPQHRNKNKWEEELNIEIRTNESKEELNNEIRTGESKEELNIEIRTNERALPLICSYFDVQLLLLFVLISLFSSSSYLFLFRCSAPPLFCSYFDVRLLLSFGVISMFSSSGRFSMYSWVCFSRKLKGPCDFPSVAMWSSIISVLTLCLQCQL